ncbi:LacI family DNA-binding transcriptional regulator [Aquibium microcysteis]|uniref:LacI family DNA-binding transcriptional regulator n=1 Tax=Aquibium microcysteis TaxID=675281 RepID=UPI00165CF8F9|nr:LacI family DNA-binding transcriptional regulator [Aquibium microcysteis]
MPGKPRIVDIALQAGVSTATVDRVLNGRVGVKGKTVKKVLDAAEWLAKSGGRPKVVVSSLKALTIDVLLAGGPGFANEILMREFHRASRQAGVKLNARFTQRANVAALKEAIEECAERGSAGVIVQPIDHRLIRDAVLDIVSRGVPLVCALTTLPGVDSLAYCGLDNRAAGRAGGLLLGHLCARKGKVAVFMSDMLYRSHEERESGARSVLRSDFPQIEVLPSINTRDNPETCYSETRELLKRHPDLAGMINLGGGNRGIEKALLESGKAIDVAYVAFNLTPLTRKALLDGTIDAVVHQDMGRISRRAVDAIIGHHGGKPPETGYIPAEIIMRENIRDTDRAEWLPF